MTQWYSFRRDALDEVEVAYDATRYRASIKGGRVVVPGSESNAAGTRLENESVAVLGGTEVATYVRGEHVPEGDLDHLFAAALIISSLVGNPRVPRARQHPRFMWTDHVALARGDDPEKALRYSQVRDPVAAHVKDARGRMAVFVRGHLKWSGEREVATDEHIDEASLEDWRLEDLFATPYAPFDARPQGIRRDPFPFDPDARDRATAEHKDVQDALAKLAANGGRRVSRPEPFDLLWEDPNVVTVIEVKTITPQNEAKQLRLGLGQVLDYQDKLRRSGTNARAVLATNQQPRDERWVELCSEHGITLVWPATFEELLAVT